MTAILPTGAAERNEYPLADGLLHYFPNALAAVAHLSKVGNDQHNPGEPMHWARNKSTDHANKILRHLIDAGTTDTDGVRHSAKTAWRALALLEDELIAAGATPGRNTRGSPPTSMSLSEMARKIVAETAERRQSKRWNPTFTFGSTVAERLVDPIPGLPKEHRRVATTEELRAAGLEHVVLQDEPAPKDCLGAAAIEAVAAVALHKPFAPYGGSAPNEPTLTRYVYSENRLPQKGDRVRIRTLWGSDEALGIRTGMTGTVLESDPSPFVRIDKIPSLRRCFGYSQLERIA